VSGESLTIHAAAPDGREGYVLLLHRPDAQGRVQWREWSSDDYVGPAREGTASVDEVEARVTGWAHEGWRLSESVHLVTGWLRAR
jgi:hypothetical protein